jgi:hypothetical protein
LIRAGLVARGYVEHEVLGTLRDGNHIGVGDLVQARRGVDVLGPCDGHLGGVADVGGHLGLRDLSCSTTCPPIAPVAPKIVTFIC